MDRFEKGAQVFTSIDELQAGLAEQRYVCNRKIATVLFLAIQLNKPVLVEGPAGVGKTELAKVLAQALRVSSQYFGARKTNCLVEVILF